MKTPRNLDITCHLGKQRKTGKQPAGIKGLAESAPFDARDHGTISSGRGFGRQKARTGEPVRGYDRTSSSHLDSARKTIIGYAAAPLPLTRPMGSLTISAWINSSSFPVDDAAIVSSLDPGFQLDTTVDTGPRTIGFKLVDPCGEVVARYGATELTRNTWYHVAGVYDGQAEDVAKLVHHGGQQVESADGLRVGRRRELAPRDARGITHPPDETVAVQCR